MTEEEKKEFVACPYNLPICCFNCSFECPVRCTQQCFVGEHRDCHLYLSEEPLTLPDQVVTANSNIPSIVPKIILISVLIGLGILGLAIEPMFGGTTPLILVGLAFLLYVIVKILEGPP